MVWGLGFRGELRRFRAGAETQAPTSETPKLLYREPEALNSQP